MSITNETYGISCEIAIADAFGVPVSPEYRMRGENKIIQLVQPYVVNIFNCYGIPAPISHCAEKQNPVDFILRDNSTLSIKSNMKDLGKVAPQNIGQPTAETFFDYFTAEFFQDEGIEFPFQGVEFVDEKEKKQMFKNFALNYPEILIREYWINLFHTDHYLHFYNLANGQVKYIYLTKLAVPNFDKRLFTFTKEIGNWNESTTIKYNGISIGEFQVHTNRNCLKFRFNMKKLLKAFENL